VSTVAIIPARGGSKGITDKNLQPVGGIPLITRAIQSALASPAIDEVYVSTDSDRIAEAALASGAGVITRPDDISGDTASSESAVLHAISELPQADTVVFIQATSPFIDSADLTKACGMVTSGEYDMVLSGVEDHGFRWEERDGAFHPIGHEASSRPRRQDLPHRILETGAFYVFRASGIVDSGSRFHGRIGVVEVARENSMEIDSYDDLEFARRIDQHDMHIEGIGPVDVVVFDFDGVHTDDRVFVDESGVESVRVKRGDGMGIGLLKKAGVPILILSSETNPVVSRRAEKLGVEVLQGQSDKASALRTWLGERGFSAEHTVFVGNDINDRGCLDMVGWPVVVSDAHPSVRHLARIVLRHRGGEGAVRELCDLVLLGMTRKADD
jgi:YrbI family 3-deoxy-D-manno-octulosonate 8-phosphate phosphatase